MSAWDADSTMTMESEVLYEANFDLTYSCCRTAVRRYMRRTIGWGLWVVLALVVVVALGEGVTRCGLGWLGNAGLILSGVYVAVLGFTYWMMMAQVSSRIKRMSSPRVWVGVSDSGIIMKTSDTEAAIRWHVFLKLWRFEEVWLLFQNRTIYTILPVDAMSPQMKEFIVQQLENTGVKVN